MQQLCRLLLENNFKSSFISNFITKKPDLTNSIISKAQVEIT